MSADPNFLSRGSYQAEQLRSGERYELSNGHAIYCAPSGGRHAQPNQLGASVVAWDPAVKEAGVDAGYTSSPGMLRAPDVAVGNVPDKPGWIPGAPDLAIEYADVGQDDADLAVKVSELLAAGTKYLWVVRLTGDRRVQVHERGKPVRTAWPGELLEAPGVLQNPVLVESLYDRTAAERATFTNLLQRRGYESLEAVLARGREEGLEEGLEEGREEGREEGLRAAVLDLCDVLGIPVDPPRREALAAMRREALDELRARLKRDRRWD